MELILISDTKLKIMLSADDMRRYELNCDTIEMPDSTARSGFRAILREARRLTGFDAADSRIFVQLYPERGGGCEMFVTKIGRTAAESPRMGEHVYRFGALSDLLCACRRIGAAGDAAVSRAYADDAHTRFYLTTDTEIPYIAEYNGARGAPMDLAYIQEHCRLFCRDAAGTLGPLAGQ